jgi:hypothetical protein
MSRTSDEREPHVTRKPRCGHPCYITQKGRVVSE